jgi:hypothetical protein
VDTRNKILSLDHALSREWPGLAIVAGSFDVLRASLIRELAAIRERTGARTLLAVVPPLENEILPRRARAELAAALRLIDYVVIADRAELERLAAVLKPLETVSLEAADRCRARQLREDIDSGRAS